MNEETNLPTVDGFLDTLSVLRAFYNISQNTTNNPVNAQAVYADSSQSFSSAGLSLFQSTFGVPPTPITGSSNETLCSQGDICSEGDLDTQFITAVAANTTTYFVNAAADFISVPISLAMWLVTLSALPILPRVASVSYGYAEPAFSIDDLSLFDVEAIKVSVMGMTIVASSGDDGANFSSARDDPSRCGYVPQFPASSQYVLAVGATSGPGAPHCVHLPKHLNVVKRILLFVESGTAEVVCDSRVNQISSGGGFATVLPPPSYQASAVASYLSQVTPPEGFGKGRAYPDVSLLGAHYTVVTGDRAVLTEYGTSASAPVIAAMITLVNDARLNDGQSTLGWIHPSLYQNYASFVNDITSGSNFCAAKSNNNNATCCPYGFNATVGWDPTTGFGSINFQAFYDFYTSAQCKSIL